MAKTVKRADGLTASQVIILNVLAKASTGLTASQISYAGKGVPVNANTIGPVFGEGHPDSLRGRGLVVCEKQEEEDVHWSITEKGRKMAGMKAQRIGPGKRVPNEVLDPVVLMFKKRRTYGLERYTDDDILDLRTQLPKDYRDVDPKDLWNQILARRKQGAFADPDEKIRKALEKVLREFGPNGTMIEDFLTEDQVQQLHTRLGVGVTDE